MSEFYPKEIVCNGCDRSWIKHEEKQSDVSLSVMVVEDAFRQVYDHVIIVSRDSDHAPAIKAVRKLKDRRVKVFAPPGRRHSKVLWALAHKRTQIEEYHVERALFGERVPTNGGNEVLRPVEYAPPS